MLERRLIVGLAILAAGCGGVRPAVSVPGAPGVTIPGGVKDALDARWDDWQMVPLAAAAATCANRFDSPPTAVLTGDWNGDGTGDVALQITSSEGRRIVAALGRVNGTYVLSEVGAVEAADGVLGIKSRGKSYRQEAKGIEHFYSLSTLAFGPCNQPETAYFWNGSGFDGRQVF